MEDKENTTKGIIFYDGLCLLCSREIDHYRKQKGADKFLFLNISSADFDPAKFNLDPYKVHKVMHVLSVNGQMATGVDAFREIWKELPKYHVLYRLSGNAIVRHMLNVGYAGFAQIRPYLPRKKSDCDSSPYCGLKP